MTSLGARMTRVGSEVSFGNDAARTWLVRRPNRRSMQHGAILERGHFADNVETDRGTSNASSKHTLECQPTRYLTKSDSGTIL